MFATVSIKTPVADLEPFRSAAQSSREGPAGTDDESLIAFQKNCPVTGRPLGSMGKPIKVEADSKVVFLCCEGCRDSFQKEPAKYVAKLNAAPKDAVLAVPEQAVIDTGAQQLVYIEREPGVFEGVEVKLGPRSGGYYAVVSGLTEGQRVAAAGAFLVDAETRLNPAASAEFFGATGAAKEKTHD
jgi:Cu(I)/Ag(I) efflux system membrane fusion protein